jgi:hypothetical protein
MIKTRINGRSYRIGWRCCRSLPDAAVVTRSWLARQVAGHNRRISDGIKPPWQVVHLVNPQRVAVAAMHGEVEVGLGGDGPISRDVALQPAAGRD